MAPNSEQEMQRLAMEMNYYRSRAEEYQNQMRSLNALIQENASAKEALESIPKNKGDTLFSLGAGVFVKGTAATDKVLVEIGAKVIAEKTIDEAKAHLDAKKDGIVRAASRLQEELEKINAAMVDLSERAEQLQK